MDLPYYENELELKRVLFIHRHGARTPIFSSKDFPTVNNWQHCKLVPAFFSAFHKIPAENHCLDIEFQGKGAEQLRNQLDKVNQEECFAGQLTDIGKMDMRQIGSDLRFRYVQKLGLLSKQFNANANELYLRSTNYMRTIESLQYLLHGLYPKQHIVGSPKVIVQDSDIENMYPHDGCSSMMVDTMKLRKEFSEKNKSRMVSVLNPLSTWHNMRDTSHANQTYRLYDMISCLKSNEVELPAGVSEDSHGKLEGLTVDLWARMYEKDESFTKRAIGRFIPDIISSLKSKDSQKMAIFSAHDSTLIPLMIAFQVYSGQYPRFGANVIYSN